MNNCLGEKLDGDNLRYRKVRQYAILGQKDKAYTQRHEMGNSYLGNQCEQSGGGS